jgi:hypothetical protein
MNERAEMDDEGRVMVTDHGTFVLLNIYFPNGGRGGDRLTFKSDFQDEVQKYCSGLRCARTQLTSTDQPRVSLPLAVRSRGSPSLVQEAGPACDRAGGCQYRTHGTRHLQF